MSGSHHLLFINAAYSKTPGYDQIFKSRSEIIVKWAHIVFFGCPLLWGFIILRKEKMIPPV